MKLKLIIIIFLIYFSQIGFLSSKINNNIILKIENEIITNYDIKNKILTILVLGNQEINQENINSLKKQALENLIIQKIKKIELLKYDFKNDDVRLNNYLNSISSNNIEQFKSRFRENNINFDKFVRELQTEFKWQKLIFNIYSNKIKLDENSIEKELNEIIKNQENIEQYELSELEILINENEIANERVNIVEKQIEAKGFEFAVLNNSISSTSSNKGYLGWINGKSLSEDIYKIIKKMKIGEVSQPIKRQNSILFLKLMNKKNSNPEKIDRAKLRINLIERKKNELFNLYSRSHLSKLKNSSFIEYQ